MNGTVAKIHLCAALLLMCACPGCTMFLWHGALSDEWTGRSMEGAIVDQEARPIAVVLRYDRPWTTTSETRYALVPLDHEWSVAEEAARHAVAVEGDFRASDLPAKQGELAVLRPFRLHRQVKLKPGQRMIAVVTRDDFIGCGNVSAHLHQYNIISADAEELAPPGQPIWPWPRSDFEVQIDVIADETPPMDRAMLVPDGQPRSIADRTVSVGGAALLTPVTLLADAAIVPMLLLGLGEPP
jgi:hypothetical protein